MVVSQATQSERAEFIKKTYLHVAGALGLFLLFEVLLQQWSGVEQLAMSMVNGYTWLIVLGVFMFVSYIADKWARSSESVPMQYLGIIVYAAMEAIIFVPIIYIALTHYGPNVIRQAGIITLVLFAALTFIAFTSKKDFSFLGKFLTLVGFIAMGVIVISILFGFTLGTLFSVAMVAFAGGIILYQTSNIIHHYQTHQHVAAALGLFASVMLMFWYVLQIVMAGND